MTTRAKNANLSPKGTNAPSSTAPRTPSKRAQAPAQAPASPAPATPDPAPLIGPLPSSRRGWGREEVCTPRPPT